MNKLQVVNEVLTKLREPTVASTTENPYAALILQFVKETYQEVVKAAEWSWLRQQFTTTGGAVSGGYIYSTPDLPQTNVISVWDNTLKYFIPRHPSLKDAQVIGTAYAGAVGPAQFYYEGTPTAPLYNPYIAFYPVPPASNSLVITVESMQDVAAITDTTVLRCPGYLMVLGAFEKALLERDGDTAQYQRALSAYTMAVASQASMDNSLDRYATDWVPE